MSSSRVALITGITGQDGSYLAELLLEKGYEVHGIVRRVAIPDPAQRLHRIRHIQDRLHLHAGSLESQPSLFRIVETVQPDECYHLAAQSVVHTSFEDAFSTFDSNIHGTLYLLDALQARVPDCRVYFAATSEMFGQVTESPQTESTRFHPRSPYAISKVAGFHLTQNYRERGMYACSGILFNHESPRRGLEFVTRKITDGVARIVADKANTLALGNLDARRDWGFAGDYVQAMWQMLQQDGPEDFVIATGVTRSVRDFCDLAFSRVGLNYQDHVVVDPRYYRPVEVEVLCGDASKARDQLGWQPTVDLSQLVAQMVDHDLKEHGR